MSPAPPPAKPTITMGKFQNVDLRVARVLSAPMAGGVRRPSRLVTLDFGPLGRRVSVGQYALVDESQLLGRHIVACVNLGDRAIGPHTSEVLMLGVPHPGSPPDQSQALPLLADDRARPGDAVF